MSPSTRRLIVNMGWLTLVILALWQGLYALIGDIALRSPLATLQFTAKFVTTPQFATHLAETSKAFVLAGIGISLGQYEQVSEDQIADALTDILIDKPRRLSMSEAALATTDGLGARRMTDMINQTLQTRP